MAISRANRVESQRTVPTSEFSLVFRPLVGRAAHGAVKISGPLSYCPTIVNRHDLGTAPHGGSRSDTAAASRQSCAAVVWLSSGCTVLSRIPFCAVESVQERAWVSVDELTGEGACATVNSSLDGGKGWIFWTDSFQYRIWQRTLTLFDTLGAAHHPLTISKGSCGGSDRFPCGSVDAVCASLAPRPAGRQVARQQQIWTPRLMSQIVS